MSVPHKSWSSLGLGAVVIASWLTACDRTEGEAPKSEPPAAEAVAAWVSSEGEGEGEGGIALDAAASDPVVFGSALALTEAHVIAARDAYAEGYRSEAAEMFAHPVSEVLFALQPLFADLGIASFDAMLTDASAAALAGEPAAKIAERADAIVAKLRAAADAGPASPRSPAAIKAAVAADQASRAAAMYRAAQQDGRYEPYLDGYGFYRAGKSLFEDHEAAIRSEDPAAANALRAIFVELARAYPSAKRQSGLEGDISAIAIAASRAELATSG